MLLNGNKAVHLWEARFLCKKDPGWCPVNKGTVLEMEGTGLDADSEIHPHLT